MHDKDFLAFLNNFDLIGLAETFAKEPVHLDNFSLVAFRPAVKRAKTPGQLMGRYSAGLYVYAKKGLRVHTIPLCDEENIIACRLNEWAICFCYNPPQSSEYARKKWDLILEQNLYDLCADNNNKVCVVGDWNARTSNMNELRTQTHSDKYAPSFETAHSETIEGTRQSKDKEVNLYGKKLVNVCKSLNFYIINGRNIRDMEGEYTFVGHQGNSMIDLGLTHIDNHGCIQLEVGEQLFSSHQPVQLYLETKSMQRAKSFHGNKVNLYRYRETKRDKVEANFKAQEGELNELEKPVENCDPNILLEKFYNIAYKALTPMLSKNKNKRGNPVLNKMSTSAGFALKYLRKMRRKGGCEKAKNNYLKYRCVYKRELKKIKEDKKVEEEEELNKLYKEGNSAELWKRMSFIKGSRKSPTETIEPEKWTEHFESLYNVEYATTKNWSYDMDECGEVEELDKSINIREVTDTVRGLKSNKACGRDGIGSKIVKRFEPFFVPILVTLFNAILKTGLYPTEWKNIMIYPIYKKKGSMSDVKNYRGIGLLSAMQKVFNKIIQRRLNVWVEAQGLIPKFQAGFRKNHSTINQVFVLQTLARKYLNRKQSLYCVYVDFSTYFDSIQRHILWTKLSKLGISKKLLTVLENMYTGTKIAVRFKLDEVSDSAETRTGCIQGDVLSPLLANIFTADLPDFLDKIRYPHFAFMNNEEVKMIQFADDVALISTSPIGLQRQLDALNEYCKLNGLKVNTNKTKAMIFRNSRKVKFTGKWRYNGDPLELVDSFKYLGINLKYDLKPRQQFEMTLNKSKTALYNVARFIQAKKCFPLKLSINLGQALVQSVFAYGAELSAWENQDLGNKLMRSFYKKCLRLPHGAPSLGTEVIIGRRSYEVFAAYRGFRFWRKLVNSTQGSLLNDALIEQIRQTDAGRDTWLKQCRNKLDRLGLGDLWLTPPLYKIGENAICRIIQTRLSDINFQEQLVGLLKLPSLAHLQTQELSKEGVGKLLEMKRGNRIRLASQLLLNCPGSLVRREKELIICSACSSPVQNRNVFLHCAMACVNTQSYTRSTVKEKINTNLPIHIQLEKLTNIYMNEEHIFRAPV